MPWEYVLKKEIIFFPQNLLNYQQGVSPPLLKKLNVVRFKLFDETTEHFVHAGLSARLRRPENDVLGVRPSGSQKDWILKVLNRDCREIAEEQMQGAEFCP